ncbi:21272_t:CDS:2, partial [Cetraspora pellucida]
MLLNDISSDNKSILSIDSFFDENFFENNSFIETDKKENFLKKVSKSLPEIENSKIFLTKSLTTKEIIYLLTSIEYPSMYKEGIAI